MASESEGTKNAASIPQMICRESCCKILEDTGLCPKQVFNGLSRILFIRYTSLRVGMHTGVPSHRHRTKWSVVESSVQKTYPDVSNQGCKKGIYQVPTRQCRTFIKAVLTLSAMLNLGLPGAGFASLLISLCQHPNAAVVCIEEHFNHCFYAQIPSSTLEL